MDKAVLSQEVIELLSNFFTQTFHKKPEIQMCNYEGLSIAVFLLKHSNEQGSCFSVCRTQQYHQNPLDGDRTQRLLLKFSSIITVCDLQAGFPLDFFANMKKI